MKKEDYSSQQYLDKLDMYFRAANYLSVAQLYLLKNPLLRDHPLCEDDIKKKLVGHWGTVPGQNFVYAHCDRVIEKYNLDMILLSGPGHGGNFFVANSYLEGTYSEYYPEVAQNKEGMTKLCKQFSFPGGIGSHCAPDIPGSIHEGGELGYSLAHGFGAVFDNPNLIATVIIGDGEAETGPLAASWNSNKFLNPARDGMVLPILHLNGYKINNPTVLSRKSDSELKKMFEGYGYDPIFVEGDKVEVMHKKMADAMDLCIEKILTIWQEARKAKAIIKNKTSKNIKKTTDFAKNVKNLTLEQILTVSEKQKAQKQNTQDEGFRFPMIILRTPKGWTGPKVVDQKKVEGTFRAHQIPLKADSKEHIYQLEGWLKSYRPEELFDKNYKLKKEIAAILPKGDKRISASPYANGGRLLKPLKTPEVEPLALKFEGHGTMRAQDMFVLGGYIKELFFLNNRNKNFRVFSPDESASNRLYQMFDVENRCFCGKIYENDENLSPDGRIMDSYLSEHLCEGWLEGYLLTGRHGMFNSYEAFIRVVDSMVSQHAKWLKSCREIPWREPISSLNLVLTSNVWQQDHNGFTHQDPGFLDHMVSKKGEVVRIYLPPDANCLLSCYDHCAKSKDYVNIIVASKHASAQWLSYEDAFEHCKNGIGEWKWASRRPKAKPDVVVVCCGSTPTLEALAAVDLARKYLPELSIRFINVVDLMTLASPEAHPHGLTDEQYDKLFTRDKPIVFNFHGYPQIIHQLTYKRANSNLHVSGYMEEGAITTPFDMRVRNKIDRYHLLMKIASVAPISEKQRKVVYEDMQQLLDKHNSYIREHGVDMPEVALYRWHG